MLAAAYTAGLVTTALVLRRRLGRIDGNRLVRTHMRILVAATVGATCATVTVQALAPVVPAGWTGSLITIAVAGLAGGLGYVAAGRVLHLTELRQLVATTMHSLRGG